MCLQCIVESEFLFEPLPGWYLHVARKENDIWPKGEYGLIRSNDPDFIFKTTPFMDPMSGFTDDEMNNASQELKDQQDEWFKKVGEFAEELVTDPRTGYDLVAAAMVAGYNPDEDGDFSGWLFNRMGRLMRAQVMR